MISPASHLSERFLRAYLQQAEVIYVGVFLPRMSHLRLLKAFPPEHPQVFAHHVTLWHFKDGGEVPDVPWGKTVDLKVLKHFHGSKAQAVVVDLPRGLRFGARVPHVTISTENGVNPVASNALIGGEFEPLKGLIGIKGQVGWVDPTERVHFQAPPGM